MTILEDAHPTIPRAKKKKERRDERLFVSAFPHL